MNEDQRQTLAALLSEGGVSRECWVARGRTSAGTPLISRKFVGGRGGYPTIQDAQKAAEDQVALSARYGGSMEAVRQVLNAETMLWEDAV